MYYASLCVIAKDEDAALPDWVSYHLQLGFEHIFVYDNGSRNPIRDLLQDYVRCGLVTVVEFPLTDKQQLSAYANSLSAFGPSTVWMAYIDVDEYLVPRHVNDIRDLLDAYREHAALGVHWKMFGSGGHVTRPQRSVAESYTAVVENNTHIKTILQPARTVGVASSHHFYYAPGYFCVNEDFIPVLGHRSYHTAQQVQLNHYYYKSREDFDEKMRRGLPTPAKSGRHVRDVASELAVFERQFAAPGVPDNAIFRVLEHHKGMSTLPQELAARLAVGHMEFAGFARCIAAHIAAGAVQQARDTLHTCLRYHQQPQAWLLAARVHLLLRNKAKARDAVARLLKDLDEPLRADAYRCLADWYRLFDQPETARGILAEMGD